MAATVSNNVNVVIVDAIQRMEHVFVKLEDMVNTALKVNKRISFFF